MLYGTSKKFELITTIKHYKLWWMVWWILKFKAEVNLKQSSNLLILLVPRTGVEPVTCPLGGGRAIQLCHRGLSGRSIAPAVVIFESSLHDHIFGRLGLE